MAWTEEVEQDGRRQGRGAGPEEHRREVQGEHYPWRRRRRTSAPCSPLPSAYPPSLPSPGRCCQSCSGGGDSSPLLARLKGCCASTSVFEHGFEHAVTNLSVGGTQPRAMCLASAHRESGSNVGS